MFIGNWLVNLFFALVAFIIVFAASFSQNLLLTTFIRASLASVASFFIAYLFRYLLAIAFQQENDKKVDNEAKVRGKEKREQIEAQQEEIALTDEDIYITSQYVKDLLDGKEV